MAVIQSRLRGALLALAAFGLYSTHDAVVKFLGGSYSPFQIVFFSGLLGFPLITIMLMSDRTDGNLITKFPLWTAIRTASAVVTPLAGFYALSKLPLAQCYAIFFSMPILITLMAIPILGEKIGLRRGLAVVVGLIGVIIVLRPGQVDFSLGHLAALSAASTGAMTSVIVRKIGHAERSVVLMLYPMAASFIVMGCAMPFVYQPMPPLHLGAMAVIAVLGLAGALTSIAAYRAAPAIIVAPMQYSQIFWAIGFGFLFFGERIDLYTGLGAGVIILSGIYIVLREDTAAVSVNRPVLDSDGAPRTSLWVRLFEWRGSRA